MLAFPSPKSKLIHYCKYLNGPQCPQLSCKPDALRMFQSRPAPLAFPAQLPPSTSLSNGSFTRSWFPRAFPLEFSQLTFFPSGHKEVAMLSLFPEEGKL